jgi:hypothetical protein
MLAVTISYSEEMTIFQSTEVRHCDPSVLIHFVRVAWRQASLCGKSKFSHTVGEHLFGV